MPADQLRFRVAARAGQNAIIDGETERLVGWIVRGQDGLLRARLAGASEPVAEQGHEAVFAALRAIPDVRLVRIAGSGLGGS